LFASLNLPEILQAEETQKVSCRYERALPIRYHGILYKENHLQATDIEVCYPYSFNFI
jgi:hypothetical protein